MEGISQEIYNLEKRYWQAMQDHDLKTAIELTKFPCIVASAHGSQTVDRASFEKMFNSDRHHLKEFTIDKGRFLAREVSPGTFVTAYEVKSSFAENGKSREINAIDTSTWIKEGDKWICAMHTEIEKTH